jgi:hypothetical protein
MAGAYNMGSALLTKFQEGENGWGKGENSFFVRGIHGITLHLINDVSNFCVSLQIISKFYYHPDSYGKITEHKCPMSKSTFIFCTL